jgi:hypothetical protein
MRGLEPEQEHGRRGNGHKRQLRNQDDQALPWRGRDPSNAEVGDERELPGHEELPEAGLRALVGLRLGPNGREMGQDKQNRE